MSKVIFAIPPTKTEKGFATTNQNRQYQYFKDPFFAYPIIPAIFASMIVRAEGCQFLWVDAVAEEINEMEFGKIIVDMTPDYIVFEANTMLVNTYYQYINDLKETLPKIKIILCGEHPTAMPEEAKEKCKADYILSGGKWYKEAYKIISGKDWGDQPLPHIDRNLTRWWLYAYANGNFKYVPATYTMAAQDCWYRPKQPCTFCTWVDYHPQNNIRPVDDVLEEWESIINMGFKEIFDDSGTFPVGHWLNEFCHKAIERGYQKYLAWGCNMRFGALQPEEFKLMADAGCRFILWGFESANQETLNRLHKGTDIKRIPQDLIVSSKYGIWNHLTCMMGYPFETLQEEYRTYDMVKYLLTNDWASSMQSTIFMPYPGTAAYKEFDEQGKILTKDWDKWDMCHEVVKLQYSFEDALELQRKYYQISYHPKFIWNKIKNIRSMHDLRFYFRLSKKVIDRFGNLVEHSKAVVN